MTTSISIGDANGKYGLTVRLASGQNGLQSMLINLIVFSKKNAPQQVAANFAGDRQTQKTFASKMINRLISIYRKF